MITKDEMIKFTIEDLKNFNTLSMQLKELREDYNVFSKNPELFKDKLIELNNLILKFNNTIESIKIAISVLSDEYKKVIIYYYFEKLTLQQIGMKMNRSSDAIFCKKKKALIKLSDLLYSHFEHFSLEELEILKAKPIIYHGKIIPVYQYTKEGELIAIWRNGAREAVQYFKWDMQSIPSQISAVCRNMYKSCKGYVWKYQ